MAESQPDQLSQFLDLDDKSVVKHNRCVDNCKSQTKSDLSKVVSGSPALCRRVENSWIRNKESLELMLASAAAPARCSLLYLQALSPHIDRLRVVLETVGEAWQLRTGDENVNLLFRTILQSV